MRFAERMAVLTEEQRLHFYEVLAHNLTVAIRGVWSDTSLGDVEKVERMKWINEILHRAKMSPVKLTHSLSEAEVERLFASTRDVLTEWIQRLRYEARGGFPEKVTAFRKDMAVHGRYGEPCPVCGTAVQRIVHAENESNYCPRCQTGGKLLADRSLSRLLKDDWPRTIEEWEGRLVVLGEAPRSWWRPRASDRRWPASPVFRPPWGVNQWVCSLPGRDVR